MRHDIDVEAIGTMAALPDDMSPFQIGTGGIYKGVHFGVVGRMKIGWKDGNWNEWFIVSDDARKGWLAEAQGFYAVSFENEQPLSKEAEVQIASITEPGSMIDLYGKRFSVVDIKEATCIGSEGELPFRAPQGRRTTSIDLTGTNDDFASIEIEADKKRVYIGSYVEWSSLQCTNFRKLEGW